MSGKNYTWAPLTDFQTAAGISGILGPALNPFLPKLTLIRGLDFLPAVNHNYGGLLGNFSSCTAATPCDADSLPDVATIDQVMAYSPKFYAGTPGLRYLHISQGVTNSMSYSDLGIKGGPVQQLKARANPLDAFNDVFGGLSRRHRDAAAPVRDKLLVDRVYADYTRLRQNAPPVRRRQAAGRSVREPGGGATGQDDAQRRADDVVHAAGRRRRRWRTTPASTPPTSAPSGACSWIWSTAALMCDQTRIITIGVHKALGPGPDSASTTLVGHYHSEDASGGTWHGLAHDFANANSRRMLKGINTWIASEVFAKLLAKLDVPEANGKTYLDNSLVYWGNELGFNHIAYSVPCLLAGSAGGFIKPGRYLDYIDWNGRAYFAQENGNVIKGIPHNRLLVTMLQAMGLAPADYETRRHSPATARPAPTAATPTPGPSTTTCRRSGQILPGIRG